MHETDSVKESNVESTRKVFQHTYIATEQLSKNVVTKNGACMYQEVFLLWNYYCDFIQEQIEVKDGIK